MPKKKTRAEKFGILQADAILEATHLTYNAQRGKQMIKACIKRLQERFSELQPKKAHPAYKEARYGKDKKKSPPKGAS
ncbi:MAG: hypothetical protein NUV64_02180 [Parcubacteria group bacterium]|nr:hypothetical protein [Parcubacteria group bacterium]MCR4342821.1 hypothetical protein [Patescibacteria group bacterium]